VISGDVGPKRTRVFIPVAAAPTIFPATPAPSPAINSPSIFVWRSLSDSICVEKNLISGYAASENRTDGIWYLMQSSYNLLPKTYYL